MALIQSIEKENKNFKKQEPVETTYSARIIDGEILFQLNMYGSVNRQDTGKVSQVIQLNKASATELIRLLNATFLL